MKLSDILSLGFDFFRAIEIDLSWLELPTITLNELFWGFLILGILFDLWWTFLEGRKK